jgi:hypothetical protein
MHGRGVLQQLCFDRVLVETGDRAQPPGHRGPGPPGGFQVAAEALDVGPAHAEQPQAEAMPPARELAQVQA